MGKYTVIAASVGGTGNKIFEYGEVVSDANFPVGNAAKLVANGFLKPIEEEVSSPAKTEGADAGTGTGNTIPAYEDITAVAIKELLTKKGVEFDAKASKRTLYNLLNA